VLSALPTEQARHFDLDGRVAESFQILKCSGCTEIGGVDDKGQYNDTLQSLGAIGGTQEKTKELEETMLRCVAAVLHISDLIFDGDDHESDVATTSTSAVDSAAKCLQVETSALISSLTKQEIFGAYRLLGVKEAAATRDALARLVYAHMFDWVVSKISECIGNSLPKVAEPQEEHLQMHTFVALLDLFGFEDFAPDSVNSFEQ
jgi:myosin heavy subunit